MSRIELTAETIAELEKLSDDWTLAPEGWRPSEAFLALERVAYADRQSPRSRWHIRRTPNGRKALGLPKL